MWPSQPPAQGGGYYAPPVVYQQAPPAPGYAPYPYGAPPQQPYGAPPQPYGAPAPAPQPYGAPAASPAQPYGAPPASQYPSIGSISGGAPPGAAWPQQSESRPGAQPSAGSQSAAPPPAAPPAQAQPSYGAPAPQPPPAQYGPQKKAVLIGCSYPGTQAQLNGCINDVQCLKHLLLTRFGFEEKNIIVLRDDTFHPDFFSTRANIYRAIQWLLTGMQYGSSLFFSFSGHGSQQADYGGDEDDGLDETILPTDYKTAGQIVDDELNQLLVRPLPAGVRLHAVIDACHSGTVMDLAYRTKFKRSQAMQWKGRPQPGKDSMGGTVVQFGACRDSQVAQDTNKMSGNVHTGAATFSFIQAIERGGVQQSYAQVLTAMSYALEHATGPASSGGMADLVMGLLGAPVGGGQTPVLSSNQAFDLNTRLML